jgi:hypothetical protein
MGGMGAVRTPVPAPDTTDEVASAPQPTDQPMTHGEENGVTSQSNKEPIEGLHRLQNHAVFRSLLLNVAKLIDEEDDTMTHGGVVLVKLCEALGALSSQQLREVRSAIKAKRQKMASNDDRYAEMAVTLLWRHPTETIFSIVGRYLAHLSNYDWHYGIICEELSNLIANNPRSLEQLEWCNDEQDYVDTTADVGKEKNDYDWVKSLARAGAIYPDTDNKGKTLEYVVTNEFYYEEIPAWLRDYTFPEVTAKMAASQR